jgi:protein phosphatase
MLLLCSDGLWEMVRHEDLRRIVSEKGSLQKICDTLIDLANANGGEDNITAVVVHVSAH